MSVLRSFCLNQIWSRWCIYIFTYTTKLSDFQAPLNTFVLIPNGYYFKLLRNIVQDRYAFNSHFQKLLKCIMGNGRVFIFLSILYHFYDEFFMQVMKIFWNPDRIFTTWCTHMILEYCQFAYIMNVLSKDNK